jgi:hypothetical protein
VSVSETVLSVSETVLSVSETVVSVSETVVSVSETVLSVEATGGDPTFETLVLGLAAGLAAVHLLAGRLWFLDGIPRSRALSFAGGVSVAYVFVHLFPEVEATGTELAESELGPLVLFAEHHVYLVALAGFVVFYGLERFAQREGGRGGNTDSDGVFWLHVGSFGVYNVLVGYLLLHRETAGSVSLLFFFVAMALHFLVNDHGLREHHGSLYHRRGRWVLAAAVLVGAGIGLVANVPAGILGVLFAFLAGGIVLNVIKEELPEERESRFPAFVVGTAGFAALLLLA